MRESEGFVIGSNKSLSFFFFLSSIQGYSITSRSSFESLESSWIPKIMRAKDLDRLGYVSLFMELLLDYSHF